MRAPNILVPRWDIYEEHLDSAAFLWMQWERALLAPDFTLGETALLEQRLRGQLEGLAEGGAPVARRLLWPATLSEEPGRVCTAALALLFGQGAEAARELVLALDGSSPARRTTIQRALELAEAPGCIEQVRPLLAASQPALQVLALEVLAFHGVVLGQELDALLTHQEPGVRAAAIRCARRLPPERLRSVQLREALESPHPGIRQEAMILGLIHGVRSTWPALLRQAEKRETWMLLALSGGEEELHLLLGMLADAALRGEVLWALGFSGRKTAVEDCIELLSQPKTAALAAEAVSAITGLPISGQYAAPAEQVPPCLEEEDLDASLEPKPEDYLPVPAPREIAAWWHQAHQAFDKGSRYLAGQQLSAPLLLQMIEHGPMRRRHALALELAIRSRGACQLQTQTWTRRQLAEWKHLQASQPRLPLQPFPQLLFR